jgi:transcriptional regulator with XRE-family HTH domain
VTGEDLKRLRERRGLDRAEFADLLNRSLGKNYNSETVARWERGSRAISRNVGAFLEELAITEFAGRPELDPIVAGPAGRLGLGDDDRPLGNEPGDTPPGPGPQAAVAQPPITSGRGVWDKACEELWEMIATGVGMLGAATGNPALVNDGAVIAQDKAALGAAWGRLAATNETFRRMLVGMTEGGAWLQVALVTGTTFSKCWQGHAAYAAEARRQQQEPIPQDDGRVARDHLAEAV